MSGRSVAGTGEEVAAEFDHNDPAMRRNCGAVYARLQTECPVARSNKWGGFWLATRYQDVLAIARDRATFSSASGVVLPDMGIGRRLLPMVADPPLHDAYRRLLLQQFGPAAVAELEPYVRAYARELIRKMGPRKRADIYEGLAKPLPTLLITRLLGVEPDPDFWHWVDTLVYGRLTDDRRQQVLAAASAIVGFFNREIAKRKLATGAGDLIGLLLTGAIDGRPYSDSEVLDHCVFLLLAGLENTAFAIRAALWHLAKHEKHRERLQADRRAIGRFVEECLRFYAPVTGLARTATTDCELSGQRITAGDRLLLVFAAANRDPAIASNPNDFDIDRAGNKHVAFGLGPHRCLGSNLARLEITTAVEEMLAAIPEFELVDRNSEWGEAGPLELSWPVWRDS